MDILKSVNFIRRKMKLSPVESSTDTSGHWTAEDLLDIINNRMDTFVSETKCLYETSTDSLVASQREYDFGSDFVEILAIQFDYKPLAHFSVEELDFMAQYHGLSETWRTDESASPYGWYLSETAGKYGIIDTPSADDTDALTIWHTVLATQLTTSSTTTDEILSGKAHLKRYHYGLLCGCVADCLYEDGREKATLYERIYKETEKRCKLETKYPGKTLPEMMNTKAGKDMTMKRFWTK